MVLKELAKEIHRKKGAFRSFIPFYPIDPDFFDFHLFRFSYGETTEEATRK
jgi:hypothetical protein